MHFIPSRYREQSLDILYKDRIVWGYVRAADTIELLTGRSDCKAWLITIGNKLYVVKHWMPRRAATSYDQVAAEQRASNVMYNHIGPDPLLALPVYTRNDPFNGCFTVSPYAGVSADNLRSGLWRLQANTDDVEARCKTLAACLLMTLQMMESLPDGFGGEVQYLHRDIKLENICFDKKHNLFRLIDFGGFTTADKRNFCGLIDPRYIDYHLASIDPSSGLPYLLSPDGMRQGTTPSLDLYLTGLAVADMFAGGLPAQLDPDQHNSLDHQLQAVRDFCWANSSQAAAMPEVMRFLLLRLLAPNPEDRPSVSEALAHPWLAGEVKRMQKTLHQAAPAWEKSLKGLLEDTYGGLYETAYHNEHAENNTVSSDSKANESNHSKCDSTTSKFENTVGADSISISVGSTGVTQNKHTDAGSDDGSSSSRSISRTSSKVAGPSTPADNSVRVSEEYSSSSSDTDASSMSMQHIPATDSTAAITAAAAAPSVNSTQESVHVVRLVLDQTSTASAKVQPTEDVEVQTGESNSCESEPQVADAPLRQVQPHMVSSACQPRLDPKLEKITTTNTTTTITTTTVTTTTTTTTTTTASTITTSCSRRGSKKRPARASQCWKDIQTHVGNALIKVGKVAVKFCRQHVKC